MVGKSRESGGDSSMSEILGTIATILAVSGVILNNRRLVICFPIWMASNLITLFIHEQAGMWVLSLRDGLFFVLAIEGFVRWRRAK